MRYHNITKDDMLNGDGLRVVLWEAGCSHCCKECQNPVTWDANGGLLFDDEAKEELNKKKSNTKKIFSKHLSKIEDSINEAKEKLEDKREARDKEKLEKYIDNRLEYTSDCISLALTLASEAKLSFLEALEAQAELDEK